MALTLSGGVITTFTSGAVNYKSHTFTGSTGELTISGTGTQAVQLLLVGGGGGGARGGGGETATTTHGNGGGGGGVFFTSSYTFSTTYPTWSIAIGAGGSGGTRTTGATNGGITSLTALGVAASTIVTSSFGDGAFFQLTGSVAGKFFVTSSTTQVDAAPIYYIVTGSTAAATMTNVINKINSLKTTFDITASALFTLSASLSAITAGTAGNSFLYKTGSASQTFAGGVDSVTLFTGSYGGFGGQPQGGNGASGGGSFPTGAAAIFADSGSAGGTQQGRSGAGGGGAVSAGSNATSVFDNPFTIWNGGNGGNGKTLTLEDGTVKHYGAGGGGGGNVNVGPGSGGTGGNSGVGGKGGSGAQGAGGNGAANTGAGGGGGALSDQSSNWGPGGNGASGVVVITYTV